MALTVIDGGAANGGPPGKDDLDKWGHSFPLWVQKAGILVDGAQFEFLGHKYLWPIFLDRHEQIVWMKAAQMGATVWMLLRAFHQALYPKAWGLHGSPAKIGFYFPGESGLNLMVKSRVEPMMRAIPELKDFSSEKSRGWKPIGEASLYFLYMGGISTKDSTPLNSEFFDEVRLMSIQDIEQAKERTSHSLVSYYHYVSTSGYPQSDIHKLFLNSDQKWWHTRCEACGFEQVLCLDFPDCVAEHVIGPQAGQVYYICKKCRGRIRDPQVGRYIPLGDPRHEVSGYQVSQLISARKTPKEILQAYKDHENVKEFYNAKLGMPYVDAENKPVSIEMLDRNVNPLAEWGNFYGGTNFMGVDQMGGVNYIFIVQRVPTSSVVRVVHFEIVEGRDPFKRTAELMEDCNVSFCGCDTEPNANDAIRFANWFGNRVFLVKYGSYKDMARWNDNWKPDKPLRRASRETFHHYRLMLDKFQSIERTLKMLADGQVEWPDPEKLVQEVFPLQGGGRMRMPIMRTHAYEHFACPVRERVEKDVDGSDYRWKWNFIKWDPHALIALDYALRISERRKTSPILTI